MWWWLTGQRESLHPSDVDVYCLNLLFHWLKSKNRQYMSENYIIFTKIEWRVSLVGFQHKFQAQGRGQRRGQGWDQWLDKVRLGPMTQ